MEYRRLGKTGLNVSVLGYGASPFGDMFGKTDETEIKRAVDKAIDNGINYFDVAPSYGCWGLAEERLGRALEGKRQEVYIATKCGRYHESDKIEDFTFDYSKKRTIQAIDESLKRLKTDYVDVYQIHDLGFLTDTDIIINETIPAMIDLKKAGKIRHIGVTGRYPEKAKTVFDIEHVATLLHFMRYNLIDVSFKSGLLPLVQGKNMGIINASVLHMGILAINKNTIKSLEKAKEGYQEAVCMADDLCRKYETNISELAVMFALDNKQVSTTLIGMGSERSLDRNLEASSKVLNYTLVRQVREVFENLEDKPDFEFHK